jgi:predicted DCC family thiol-disulfide oxidoreductase YuxK
VNRLYVLFDGECELCARCRDWLIRQPKFVPLEFIPFQSPEVSKRFPGIQALGPAEQLLVVGDNGAVYRGPSAWIICLWALSNYRLYAQRLADPILLPFARIVCELLSRNRFFLSRQFFRQKSETLVRQLSPHGTAPRQACVSNKATV